jgi:hypothetical protein
VQDSKFWRAVAVVICGGLFYVGHGLHNSGNDGMPSLVNTAHAGGVAVDASSPLDRRIYTSAENGMRLYVWDAFTGVVPKYIYTAVVPGIEKYEPPQQAQQKKK